MSPYQPTSRRPIANPLRATAKRPVEWCVKANVHPDTISYISIVTALAAGLCFWKASSVPSLLLLAPFFCYARLFFNMLDGMVALHIGAWTAYAWPRYPILDWTLIVICIGCVQTIVIRFQRILHAIHAKSPKVR